MASETVKGGIDTWAGSGKPDLEHGDDLYLRLKDGEQQAYIHMKSPAPRGATILSGILRLRARGSSAGARDVGAKRVSSDWKASKLNWNNKPGVVGVISETTVGALDDGDVIDIDVTTHLQTVAGGSPHYGWRITTTGASTHKIYGLNAGRFKPVLIVEWSNKPQAPTSLEPSGGAVGTDKPVLTFDYPDVTGATALVAVQVQIDAANDFSAADFDSGEVATTVPELDLADTAYAGLADGATTYWRARVKDAAGLWSDWSDVVSFSRDNKGTVTIDNPAADPNDYVLETTPSIAWTFTGETQEAWQVRIYDETKTRVVYDSGKRTGVETSHTVPGTTRTSWSHWPRPVLYDDGTYVVQVRIWDTKTRVATPGDPIFAAAERTFTVNDEVGVTAPAGLTVAQVDNTPFVDLEWTRGTFPDYWTIGMDGRPVAALVDPDDTFDAGTTHKARIVAGEPFEAHTYYVRAVVNGESSVKSNQVTITPEVGSVWLLDIDDELAVALGGTDVSSWRMTDQVAVYNVVGASVPVQVTAALQGISGSFTGVLEAHAGRTHASYKADVLAMKARPRATRHLVAADMSIPVKIRNLSITPHPESLPNHLQSLVSFDFFQCDDLDFEAEL
ncbi:MAG TPA: DNRLRE domain-containing protein [Nocardioidaceae bacterium]|nr:DNRLRE domain-containing protein [Nocardioidaceae bacterium]